MQETLDKLIFLLDKDNGDFLKAFPDNQSTFEYSSATDEEIKNFELIMGIKLPQFLIDYYKQFNPRKANIMFTDFLGLENIIKSFKSFPLLMTVIKNQYIPIADNSGDMYCINTLDNTSQIFYFSHEEVNFSSTGLTLRSFIEDIVNQKIKFDQKRNNGY